MIEDSRGQVSIEFILVVGAILTMTIVGIPLILRNAEMNKGLAAARDGATYGAAMIGLGYTNGSTGQSGVVKIINMTLEYQNVTAGLEHYRIRFYVSAPAGLAVAATCTTIENQAINFLNYAMSGSYSTASPVDGSYYRFTTACNLV